MNAIGSDSFSCFKNLDYLGLECLNLQELSGNAFRGLNKLTELSVSQTELRSLEEGTFDCLENLEEKFESREVEEDSVGFVHHVEQLEAARFESKS